MRFLLLPIVLLTGLGLAACSSTDSGVRNVRTARITLHSAITIVTCAGS